MARQAEAEREKRAKIINAEGESLAAAALGEASDTMMAHPLALQLRNLQSLVEIGVDKNTTVVFPAPLMSTIAELGSFLASEQAAATRVPAAPQREEQAAEGTQRSRRCCAMSTSAPFLAVPTVRLNTERPVSTAFPVPDTVANGRRRDAAALARQFSQQFRLRWKEGVRPGIGRGGPTPRSIPLPSGCVRPSGSRRAR